MLMLGQRWFLWHLSFAHCVTTSEQQSCSIIWAAELKCFAGSVWYSIYFFIATYTHIDILNFGLVYRPAVTTLEQLAKQGPSSWHVNRWRSYLQNLLLPPKQIRGQNMAWGKPQILCFNFQWTCSGSHLDFVCTCLDLFDFYSCMFRSTPVETLHTILLGTCKHLVKKFMGERSTQEKKEILARMAAFPYCGFSTRVTGNICYYYKSFVGRDFKAWIQMAPFITSPYLSQTGKKCCLLLAKVCINFNYTDIIMILMPSVLETFVLLIPLHNCWFHFKCILTYNNLEKWPASYGNVIRIMHLHTSRWSGVKSAKHNIESSTSHCSSWSTLQSKEEQLRRRREREKNMTLLK